MSYGEALAIANKYGGILDEDTITENTGIHWGLRTVLNNDELLQTKGQEVLEKLYGNMDKRSIANAEEEITLDINGEDVTFTRQSEFATKYHNPGENVKLVGSNGMEIVVNRESGQLESNSRSRGTFNFSNDFPYNLGKKGEYYIPRFRKDHGDLDMLPYYPLGNDRLDAASVGQRYDPTQSSNAQNQEPGMTPVLFPLLQSDRIYPVSSRDKYQQYLETIKEARQKAIVNASQGIYTSGYIPWY